MKRTAMRILMLLMAAVMIMSIAACGGENGGGDSSTPAPPSDTNGGGGENGGGGGDNSGGDDSQQTPARNLGGMQLIIGDWWTDPDAPKRKPQNLRDEMREDHIYNLEQEYGFTVRQISLSGWGDYLETFTTSVMAGDPGADIFIMSAGWAMSLMAQGLLYPLNTLDSIDVNDSRWNASISQGFVQDGNTYAITPVVYFEPRNFLFWNKRLFEEAGIDPHLPYDLQASGEWTWDALWDLCEKLSRDTDGDGINDKWAMTGFDIEEVVPGLVYSNFGNFIGIDPATGEYYNATKEMNFIEAVQFARRIYDGGHWATYPEGAEWDWFVTAFVDGHAAMIIREAYSTDVWQHMDDDWGMVFVPKGPRADDYRTYFSENVYVLPFNTPKEKAEDIMYAFSMYNEPMPFDVENPDYWKDDVRYGYPRFRDTRAVDETLAMLYDGRGVVKDKDFVPGIEWNPAFGWGFMNADETPIERIEAAAPIIQAVIDNYYGR